MSTASLIPPSQFAADPIARVIATGGLICTKTLSAVSGRQWCVDGLEWSMDTDPAAAVTLTVVCDGTTYRTWYIKTGGPGFFIFPKALAFAANKDVVISLSAPGGSILSSVAANAWLG